jgi:hypothetical protein
MPSLRDRISNLLHQRRWLAVVAGFAVIEVVYVFFVSAGHFTRWPTYVSVLDDLAEGFRSGHLHLAVEPRRALLAKANPFDPVWRPLWYWDASLYNGHYYLYWGPVPALLLAGFKTLFRVHARVGDQVVVFALASLQALAGVALIDRMQRRLFPALPGFFVVLAAAVFAFANPTPYNLARAGVYEAAIVGGHAFLIAGLVFAFDAISALGRQRSRLALAGISWTLALGCRASIAPAIALLAVVTCFLLARRDANRWRLRALAFRWLAAPIAVGCVLLLTYNKLRFDAWLDFGRHYQMTWIAFGSSPAYLPANLWSYAVRPFSVRCTFPYLFSIPDMGRRALPAWLNPARGYIVYEPVVGCLLAIPWAWLAPVTAVIGARRLLAPERRGGSDASPDAALTWLLVATTIAAVGSFLVPLSLFWATMRFLGDAAPALTIAATCAWWLWHQRLRDDPARRRLVVAAAVVLGGATIAAGLALGFEGQYRHFHQHNPVLLEHLEKALSFC